MTATLKTATADSTTPGFPGVVLGRTTEGFLAALAGENAFAVLPGAQGRFYLASGWNIRRPIEEWKRSDFYGHSGELADEAAFRAKVEGNADHQRERRALGRREITLERQPEIDALS